MSVSVRLGEAAVGVALGTVGGTTTYVGNYFEWIYRHSLRSFQQTIAGATSTMVKYYYAGSTLVAMRTGTGSGQEGWVTGNPGWFAEVEH